MTTEEKFNAAVNVIRNLPKNGAYQPSHDLKLRFYGYFKQATDGPCSIARPAFWDIIGRSKYDAWKRLGNMSKREAMENYVEELKKIVETMSYNDNVGMFLGSLGNFYDHVPVEDIEMLLGPVIERMRSQPGSPLQNSPLGSRETSPTRIPRHLVNKSNMSSLETSPLSSMSASPLPPETDDEDEEFIDTVETTPHASRKVFKTAAESPPPTTTFQPEPAPNTTNNNTATTAAAANHKPNGHIPNGPSRNALHNGTPTNQITGQLNGKPTNQPIPRDDDTFLQQTTKPRDRDRDSPSVPRRRVAKANGGPKPYVTDLSEPLREAVLHLQKDLDRITARVRSLEVAMLSQPQWFHEVELCKGCNGELDSEDGVRLVVKQPVNASPVPEKSERCFPDVSRPMLIFIIVWPFFAHVLMKFLQMRRRMKNCKHSDPPPLAGQLGVSASQRHHRRGSDAPPPPPSAERGRRLRATAPQTNPVGRRNEKGEICCLQESSRLSGWRYDRAAGESNLLLCGGGAPRHLEREMMMMDAYRCSRVDQFVISSAGRRGGGGNNKQIIMPQSHFR